LPTRRAMSCTTGARSSAGTSRRCSIYAVAGQLEAITCTPCAHASHHPELTTTHSWHFQQAQEQKMDGAEKYATRCIDQQRACMHQKAACAHPSTPC
jgi:hypothetical protein